MSSLQYSITVPSLSLYSREREPLMLPLLALSLFLSSCGGQLKYILENEAVPKLIAGPRKQFKKSICSHDIRKMWHHGRQRRILT